MEKWLSMKELVKSTNYAETTIRRYLNLFQEFVVSKEFGKRNKYSLDMVELIKEIAGLYDTGNTTEEIRLVLRSKHSHVYDIAPIENVSAELDHHRNNIDIILSQNQIVVESLQELVATQRNEIETLKNGMEDIQQEIQELKNKLVSKKISWWKFW